MSKTENSHGLTAFKLTRRFVLGGLFLLLIFSVAPKIYAENTIRRRSKLLWETTLRMI